MVESTMSLSSKRSTQEANPVITLRQAESDSYTELSFVVILKWAGKDATEIYEPVHPPDTLDKFVLPMISPNTQDL